ncbi:oxidoreductase, partial [Halomonas sp. ND22Bw]
MTSVSVVGLGAMGRPIARNLLGAGFDVTVWNRSPEAVAELVEEGASGAKTVAEAFQSGVVLSMLADDSAVSSAILDPAV